MAKISDKIASALGTVLEWYDFALYGFFSHIIAKLYFPSASSSVGLLKTFSIFAVGFFARPIGALIFGHIGDKYGRKASLKMTPLLITIPTLIFSFLPTYQSIGIFAPIILIFLRIFQGICIGGEYSSNIIYLCESSIPSKVYFSGSIGSCSGSLGILLASLIATLFYHIFSFHDLESWGWRIAFALSSIVGLATYSMRKRIQETPVFKEILIKNTCTKNPILIFFKNDFRNSLIAIGLTFLPATAFYYVFMFLPNFLNDILKFDTTNIIGDSALSLLIRLFFIPFIGLFADKVGGILVARIACILYLILSYPLFYGITHYTNTTNLYILCFAILTTLNAATTPGLLVSLLNANTRCTTLSFSFNFTFGVFGGIVPLFSLLLIKTFHNTMAPIYYLMFAAMVTFYTTFLFKKRQIYDGT